jgi:hypothetical protein
VALKKPSDFFGKKENKINTLVIEKDNSFRDELTKVESLSEQLNQLQQELTEKTIKSDLEILVHSEISRMRENFEVLKLQFRQSNKENIDTFDEKILELTEIIDNLVEIEIPKYKNKITKNEFSIKEKVNQFQQSVENSIHEIREEIENKFNNIAEGVDDNIEYFNQQLLETSSQVQKTTEIYTNLSKIVESRISKENEQLEEYSDIIKSIQLEFNELQKSLNEKFLNHQSTLEENIDSYQEFIENKNQKFVEDYQKKLEEVQINIDSSLDTFSETYRKDIANIKTEIVINEKHIKNVDKFLQEYHQDLVDLKEDVFNEIDSLPVGNLQENIERLEKKIDFIKETYSKIEPEVIIQEVIQESNFTEPEETKNKDSLTPLNQNFVTLDQLQQHYRLFLNRIQQQLSTLGGGGETRLKYLDDIVGIATNPSAYDGKYLKYNHTLRKFEFDDINGGSGSQTLDDVLKLGNISSLGMNVGVITSSLLNGNLIGNASSADYATSSGIASYASIAGLTTALQNSRTISLTGDIVGSVNFDGTQNVSIAASIQPNSVQLGTDTVGNYVQTITGTSNQISVTNGVGEGSTSVISISNNPLLPGNVTIANDLQVNNNLNVNGNITIGGTAAYIISNDFRVKDSDIVTGFTTDSNGNDVSNDITANHGGIAVASTVGNPLVQLYNVSIGETNPATYKKIMWFKSGSFAGLNTDAWLINYAVGIGSTQFPSGTRLAAGSVQFSEHDLTVVRNINSTGIITASAFSGNLTGTATTATNLSDASNITTGIINSSRLSGNYNINVDYATSSGISTLSQGLTGTPNIAITNLNASGITTLGSVRISSGIVTATSGIVTYYGDGRNLTITNPGIGIATASGTVGTGVTLIDLRGAGISTVTVSSGIATINISGGGTPDISPVMMSMIF